jgi:hypothetical protein
MKTVPPDLLTRIHQVVPENAKVVPRPWAYEDEDYNIAVFMPPMTDHTEMGQLKEAILEVVMDWDERYGTYTVCLVHPEEELTRSC